MRRLWCRIAGGLPEAPPFQRALASHRSSCLLCQARRIRIRSLQRDLAALADEVFPAPSHLAPAVMSRLGRQGHSDPGLPSHAAARYAAAAGAATAAAVISGLARRRSKVAGRSPALR